MIISHERALLNAVGGAGALLIAYPLAQAGLDAFVSKVSGISKPRNAAKFGFLSAYATLATTLASPIAPRFPKINFLGTTACGHVAGKVATDMCDDKISNSDATKLALINILAIGVFSVATRAIVPGGIPGHIVDFFGIC